MTVRCYITIAKVCIIHRLKKKTIEIQVNRGLGNDVTL